jgi:hypothetical protein
MRRISQNIINEGAGSSDIQQVSRNRVNMAEG